MKSVTVLELADKLNADQVLLDNLKSMPNVIIHVNAQTTEVVVDVLDVLRTVSPSSKRIVLTPFGSFQKSLEALRPAMAARALDR